MYFVLFFRKMTRYTTVFLVLGGLLAGSVNARGIAMLQTGSRAARTANLAKMSEEVVAQVNRGKVTPEVQENINKMLGLIVQIRGEINEDHTAAQKNYNGKVAELGTTTTSVTGKKTTANDYDEKRFTCYGTEKVLLEDWEAKAQIELDERLLMIKLCNIREEAEFDVAFKHFGEKSCNVSDTDSLQGAALAKCPELEDLHGARNTIKSFLQGEKLNHTQAHIACDRQTEIHRLAEQAMHAAWTAYENQREKCTGQEYSAENVMCEFGVALQEKCDALRAMLAYQAQVEEVKGTHHSEVDREKEWDAMTEIKCLLVSYVDSPPAFDDAKKKECLDDEANKYPNTFEYSKDKITAWSLSSATTDSTWNCEETHVTFKGQAYKIVPSNDPVFENAYNIKSADYTVVDMDYEVNNDNTNAKFGGDPFEFCNVDAGKGTSDGSADVRRDHA